MKILNKVAFTKKFLFVILSMLIISIPIALITIYYLQNTRQSVPSFAPEPPHPTASWKAHTMAWIYPGPPACNAVNEYQLTTGTNGCNAYSSENALEIKKYSIHQYVTVSGNTPGMDALVTSQAKMVQAVTTLKTFLDTVKFTGVEIDFEGFSHWTPQQYHEYKNFLMQLGNTLHQNGYKLMIDGPAVIADDSSRYQWRYEDFNTFPVDYIVVMEYDWQYDFGIGTPVAPLVREQDVTRKILGKIMDINDNASAEMMFTSAGVFYDYADSQTVNTKRSLLEALGIKNISVWHLGGNQWFSGKVEPHA